MNLRLLTAFRVVAECGSVSAASRILLTSQPALSRQIQQLERETGVRLFARDRGRLQVTAAGRAFLEAAVDVLSRAEAATALAQSLAAGRLTKVHMAAPTTTLTDVLAPFLATLRPADPIVTVDDAQYAGAIEGLRSTVDLAIVTAPPPHRVDARKIAVLPVWAYVHASHRLAESGEVTIEHLVEERLILLDSAFRARTLLDEALIEAGLARPEIVECRNPQVAQALAAAGRGVAIVSDDPRFGLLPKPIRTGRGLLTLTLHAAWDRRHHAADELDDLAARLADYCVERYGPGVAAP